MSFSSSECESPLWATGLAGATSWAAVEATDALEVGRVVLVVVVEPEDEVGRGVQRRLYMHSAGACQRWRRGLCRGGLTMAVEDVEAVEDHGGGAARGAAWMQMVE